MPEPAEVLVKASLRVLDGPCRDLRARGWDAGLVVDADPLRVSLVISLPEFNVPIETLGWDDAPASPQEKQP